MPQRLNRACLISSQAVRDCGEMRCGLTPEPGSSDDLPKETIVMGDENKMAIV